MSAPTIVVFDLGGVLIDWDPRHLYRKMFDDEVAMERFLGEVCNIDWIHELDAGLPFETGVAQLTARHPGMEPYIEAYWKRWPEMVTGAIAGSVDILRALKAQDVPVYALSNWSVETWPHAQERFDFLDLFDGMVISGFEGTRKPAPAIFDILSTRYAVAPSKAVFIDDRLENVAAALSLGFHGVHFTTPGALAVALEGFGLLPK